MKALLLYCAAWTITCTPLLADFPTEEEVQSRLSVGMTSQKVVSLFGTPITGVPERPRDDRVFNYLCPIAQRTREAEGYVGFKAFFEKDRLTRWQPIHSNPSYDPDMHVREHLLPVAWWWGLVFIGAFVYAVWKAFRRGRSEYDRMLEAYANRGIPTSRLPPDFRFITHETTLADVTRHAGPASRVLKLPVREERAAGYGVIEDGSGPPAILIHEYQLPYRAAVIVMPEYPFEPENRIRAVFYRGPLTDEE